MTELVEQNDIENFENDNVRLKFISRKIHEVIKNTEDVIMNEFHEVIQETMQGFRQDSLEDLFFQRQRKINSAVAGTLNELGQQLTNNKDLVNYAVEIQTMIEVVRVMFLQRDIIKYKDILIKEGHPGIDSDEIVNQDRLRNDLTEARATIGWYILQNSENLEYLRNFLASIHNLLGARFDSGFKTAFFRGLNQELGVFRLLKDHFPYVRQATQKEDAHYAIDFVVKTKTGRNLVIQSKSSGPFGHGGIFDEKLIKKQTEDLEKLTEDLKNLGQEDDTQLNRAKRMVRDTEVAKQYMREIGVENPEFFIIIASPNNFEWPTGQPKYNLSKSLVSELTTLVES